MIFTCTHRGCEQDFTEKTNLNRHIKNQHGNLWACKCCQQLFNRYDNYIMHDRTCHFKTTGKRKMDETEVCFAKKFKCNVEYVGGALQNTIVDYQLNFKDENQDDIVKFLKESVLSLECQIKDEIKTRKAIKFYLSLYADFHLASDTTFKTDPPVVLSTSAAEVFESSDVGEILHRTYQNLVKTIEDFQLTGSGWVLDKLVKLDLHILEFDPLRATSYIPLPKELQNSRKGIVNIRTKTRHVSCGWLLRVLI